MNAPLHGPRFLRGQLYSLLSLASVNAVQRVALLLFSKSVKPQTKDDNYFPAE